MRGRDSSTGLEGVGCEVCKGVVLLLEKVDRRKGMNGVKPEDGGSSFFYSPTDNVALASTKCDSVSRIEDSRIRSGSPLATATLGIQSMSARQG